MRSTLEPSLSQSLFETSAARERAKERESDSQLWTLAVAQTLVDSLPPPPLEEIDAPLVRAAIASAPPAVSAELAGTADELLADGPASPGQGPPGAISLPAEISAEVSDERFGRLHLRVARAEKGLDIVINVADARVKALIEAEQAMLMKTLKDAGLRVSSVQIGSPPRVGTALAQDGRGAEKARGSASRLLPTNRRRAYVGTLEEDDTDGDSEGVNFTA